MIGYDAAILCRYALELGSPSARVRAQASWAWWVQIAGAAAAWHDVRSYVTVLRLQADALACHWHLILQHTCYEEGHRAWTRGRSAVPDPARCRCRIRARLAPLVQLVPAGLGHPECKVA